jgi:hypothetical protein
MLHSVVAGGAFFDLTDLCFLENHFPRLPSFAGLLVCACSVFSFLQDSAGRTISDTESKKSMPHGKNVGSFSLKLL